MACNIMNEYIKLTKGHLNQYMKLIFKSKFENSIFEEFWKSYLNARYYDLNGYKNDNTLKTEILLELETKKEKLLKKSKNQRKIIEDMYIFFTHILYFDKVIPNKDLEKTIDSIDDLRRELLGKNDEDFKKSLKIALEENTKQINDLLQKYGSTDFYISISNYRTISNVYKVTLKHNFKMPMVYSNFAINKAFSTGTVNEDKLFIEYSLMSIQIIQDIIRGNFKKQYIVEFADTLFEKQQKMERLLKLVNNQAIQDKMNLKIKYELFLKNKEIVYQLMKKGFRFVAIIDNTFEGSLEAIEKLKVFQYILINENAKWYHHIIDNIDAKNVIEIASV